MELGSHVDMGSRGEVVRYLKLLLQSGQVRQCSHLRVRRERNHFAPVCGKDWASWLSANNVDIDKSGYTGPSSYHWPECPEDCEMFNATSDFLAIEAEQRLKVSSPEKEEKTPDRPAAFLSYSSENKDVAGRLARNLIENGVDVWYDQWQMKPGDSLRRKIDEGIERAGFFLVLLTPESLASEWVATELDAGMVRRIQGYCRLIPILRGIQREEVPATLQGIRWVVLDDYDSGLQDLLNGLYDRTEKPVPGEAPSWASSKSLTRTQLSKVAESLAVLLNERSKTGTPLDPLLNAQEVKQALGVSEDHIATAADELDELGLVTLHKAIGMGAIGFYRISPTAELFFETDPDLRGWDPEQDSKALAAALVNTGKEAVGLEEVDSQLGWGPRRMNPAAQYLVTNDIAEGRKFFDGSPYCYSWVQVTPRTKRHSQHQ